MPRDTRTRRLSGPSSVGGSTSGMAPPPLVSLLARTTRLVDLLLPLGRDDERIGMLTIGFGGGVPASLPSDVPEVADTFLVALEFSRLRQRDDLQRDLRQLLDEFSQSISGTLQLTAGLDIFCHG